MASLQGRAFPNAVRARIGVTGSEIAALCGAGAVC
jgi:hypothetical protein